MSNSTSDTEQCPECGAEIETTKGVAIESGERIEWDYCADNCGWEGPSRPVRTDGGAEIPYEQHLYCRRCKANPSVARLGGAAVIVCHCTHVDGEIGPLELDEMSVLSDRWDFIPEADVGNDCNVQAGTDHPGPEESDRR